MADELAFDYSQYPSWRQIKAPTGAIYYIVPGTGYVYDPFLSQQKGRPVLWTNPEPAVNEKETAEKKQRDAEKAAAAANSPLGQLAPVAGTVGGLIAANYAINGFGGAGNTAQSTIQALQGIQNVNPATTVPAVNPGDIATSFGGGGSGGAGGGGSFFGDAPVGPTGSVPPGAESSLTLGNIASGVGAAYGAYQVGDALQNGGEGLRTGLTTLGAGLGGFAGPLGAVAGAGVGNAVGYGLQGDGAKNDLALAAMGPVAWPLLGAKKLGLLGGLMHKTTKQYEQERWGKLKDEGVVDAEAAFAANHPQGDTGVWQDGEFAGKKWNFEDAQTLASKDPKHFYLVLGNFQADPEWSSRSDDVKNQVISQAISEGLYDPDKGDILVKDKNRFKEILDGVSKATPTVTPDTAVKTQGNTTMTPQQAALLGQNPQLQRTGPLMLPQQPGARLNVAPPMQNPAQYPGAPGQMIPLPPARTPAANPGSPISQVGARIPVAQAGARIPVREEDLKAIAMGKELAKRMNKRDLAARR